MKIRLIAATTTALLLGACTLQAVPGLDGDTSATGSTPQVNLVQSTQEAAHSSTAAVIQRVLPSVVNVRVTSLGVDPFGSTQAAKGEGSGVVIDKAGVILTNNHVIEGAVNVTVALNDGRTLDGTVIGADPEHDLAVVRVQATDLTPITIGRSSALQLGDPVIALGFPLGLGGPTVTKGIVSGLDRTIRVGKDTGGTEHLVGLLQTDAAINPGNSGGALVDTNGHLVGINTAAAQAGSAENVGFSIAIDEALPVIKDILTKPIEQQAFLGVQLKSVSSNSAAAQFGASPDTRGAGVIGVIPGSAAENAAIQQGDIIIGIDDHSIGSAEDLTSVLSDYKPGDEVAVRLIRSDAIQTLHATLTQRPTGLATPKP